MCQTVVFAKSGIECETVKELREALPDLELIKDDIYKTIDETSCLCQIDLEATFNNAGIIWKSDGIQFTIL